MVVLDGIGEDIGLSFTVFLGVLLRTKNYRLTAMQAVDAVNNLIETFHFLELFGIDVEEILLDGGVGADAHDNDAGLLILIARTIDSLKNIVGSLNDSNG